MNSINLLNSSELYHWKLRFDSMLSDTLENKWNGLHPYWKHRLLYSLKCGGKRIRALMTYSIADAFGENIASMDSIAIAIELVHTYSLIHDDLPAMDDDDFRRGYLSAHRAFNEADAILMGDGLLTDAFHLISTDTHTSVHHRLALVQELSSAAGSTNLVYGQWLDLYQNIESFDQLCELHHKKTGALFSFCLKAGAIIAGKAYEIDECSKIGKDIGLAFQLQDDLLDMLPMAKTGKSKGKDEKHGKKTAVTFLGHEETSRLCEQLYTNSIGSIQRICKKNSALEILINTLRYRLQE